MTDKHYTRRQLLVAGMVSPAALGIGIKAIDNATATQGGDSTPESERTVQVTGFGDADDGVASPTLVIPDDSTLDSLDASSGQQIRLEYQDEYALYTLGPETTTGENALYASGQARCRIDADSYREDEETECPTYGSSCDLATEPFEATAKTRITVDQSPEEARENGELIEQASDGDTDLLVLAPHGGMIEPHTDEQVVQFRDAASETPATWRCRGWRPGGGAFRRWHVPSTELDLESFAELPSLAADASWAVSFHGNCPAGVRIGGGAPESVRRAVRDAIAEELPSESVELADGRYRNAGENVLVNQVADDGAGIWIGQSRPIREQSADAIATATASELLE
ncbi:poly-gamma-glutamate hydrolase family protein [Halobacterium sp. R2-5]|uniref:poly-gamma-glutamate hydrolase family protein n=1 Tax=Halobacterium sp. R2-5 TaxID=2715751 RepID=UPI00141E7D31|nr:poly-gamma-glutamate hydrolase family protein [Halobacterium sp. R2-5]NIC01009.1 hypothetical protein [Halobacterium sp. R2-5]